MHNPMTISIHAHTCPVPHTTRPGCVGPASARLAAAFGTFLSGLDFVFWDMVGSSSKWAWTCIFVCILMWGCGGGVATTPHAYSPKLPIPPPPIRTIAHNHKPKQNKPDLHDRHLHHHGAVQYGECVAAPFSFCPTPTLITPQHRQTPYIHTNARTGGVERHPP